MKALPEWFIGEFFSTFILVFFGCGSVCAAVFTGAQVGVFQVAIVWGFGIATAIYLTTQLSGAHMNPAVTITMAFWGKFPKTMVLKYIVAQMLGAFFGAMVLYIIFSNVIAAFEQTKNLIRGASGSELSAMGFCEFFPNPSGLPLTPERLKTVSHLSAFLAEFIGTTILLLVIFCVTDRGNHASKPLAGLTIGLTVTILISVISPLTMACFNPARDFAPRLFCAISGWGLYAFKVNGIGWFTVYIIAPIAGGIFGGALYNYFFESAYKNSSNLAPVKQPH